MAEDAGARLVAVLSTERSGSTLLAATLGGHARVLAPPELHLLRYGSFAEWRQSYPRAMASLRWLMDRLGEPAEDAAIERAFAGRDTLSVCHDLLRRVGPERFLVDKTPAYARSEASLARLAALRPIYVWLLRHPLGVAASMVEREEQRARAAASRNPEGAKRRPWYRRLIRPDPTMRRLRAKIRYWREVHGRIERFLAAAPPGDVTVVHYEEFLRQPAAHVERLAQALGVEPEPAMWAPWRNLPEGLAWGIGDEKAQGFATFDPARAHAWRDRFSEQVLDWRTCRLMRRLGVLG